jgi:hypothetical protein
MRINTVNFAYLKCDFVNVMEREKTFPSDKIDLINMKELRII